MRKQLALAAAIAVFTLGIHAQTRKTLDIYVVDVEGGNATLFVAPSGQSVLIDTGNGGAAAVRDGDRILAAAKDAGLTQIDHLITTHWHGDHFGAMEYVSSKLPIKHYIDHGALVEPPTPGNLFVREGYPVLYGKATHTVAKPGDRIAIPGIDWRIVESAGQHTTSALPGAGKPNPYCADYKPGTPDPTENAQSVGSILTFGKFRVAHLGDLTWNKEFELMCPNNPIGTVDLFIVSHHGQAISNSPQLVHALRPRVMVMNNGTRKGGQPDAMKVLHSSPGLEDLWQMHFSLLSGQEYTVPGMFIANTSDDAPATMPIAAATAPAPGPGAAPPPAHNGAAYWVKISASEDGSFTVTNQRNGFSKTYAKKRQDGTVSRKVIVRIATSADGYVARPDGDLEWLTSLPAPEGFYGMGAFTKTIDTKVLGRKTFEISLKLGARFNRHLVFSRHPPPANIPSGVEFVNEAIAPFMQRLREQPGKDIWLMGGGDLIASFLDEQAIDEFVISVVPVFIGDGIPLIARRHRHVPLELLSTGRFDNGVVQQHYRVKTNPSEGS